MRTPKWPVGTFRVQGPAWDPVEVREEPLRFPHLPHDGNQFSKILRRWQILLSWSHVSEAGSVLDSFLERQFALGVKGTVPGPELFVCSVAQPCPTLCHPTDCSPPGSYVRGILQARILEWVAMPSSRRSSQPRDRTWISCSGRQVLYHLATCEILDLDYVGSKSSSAVLSMGPCGLQLPHL